MNKTVWRASTASQHEIKCVASPSLPQLFIHNAVRTPCCSGPSTSSLLSSPRRVRRLYHWCLPAVEQQDGTCIHDGVNSWSRPSAPAARSGELSPGPQVFGDKHVAYLIPCPLHPHYLYTHFPSSPSIGRAVGVAWLLPLNYSSRGADARQPPSHRAAKMITHFTLAAPRSCASNGWWWWWLSEPR